MRIFMGMYRDILESEETVLSEIIEKQMKLKKAVNDKNWSCLMECISELDELAEKFNALDEQRAQFSDENAGKVEMNDEEVALLSRVRGKLIKSRAESRAMCEYIHITKEFVQTVLDTAVPNSRARVYSRKGYITNSQPSSVVLNTLF